MTALVPPRQIWAQRLAIVGALAILPSFVFAGFSQTQSVNGVTVTNGVNLAGLLIVAIALQLILPVVFRHNILDRLDAAPTPAVGRLGAALLAILCLGQGAVSLGLVSGDALMGGVQMAMLRFGLA